MEKLKGKVIKEVVKVNGGELAIYFTDGSQASIYPTNENVVELNGDNDIVIDLVEWDKLNN